ncbi:nitric oxide reductase activation protein NorD [Ancylobacter sp. VNQ12]|uniref:nitric oxide reductase activation protein NorD n=1 Tax=Ancylobacter sp. VNQ12 TaxID=3400920 RepID=UPI003C0AF59D
MSAVRERAGPAAARLAELMRARETLRGPFEVIWRRLAARRSEEALEPWAAGVLALVDANAGALCLIAFWRASGELAGRRDPAELGEMSAHLAAICREAGAAAAIAVLDALLRLERQIGGEDAHLWRALHRLAQAAPESVETLAARAERVWHAGHGVAFADFIEAGLRAAGRDPSRRRAFFSLEDPLARSLAARIGAGAGFAEVEEELGRVLTALWGRAPELRSLPPSAPDVPRRASIAGPVIRLPEVLIGVEGSVARQLYLATAVHAGAHLAFGNPRFPVGKFKPVQIALATLVEDARIEELAMRAYPGLRRLWAPYHRAGPEKGPTVAALLARVARGLFDPAYDDPDDLVGKAQCLFRAAFPRIDDPAISLNIGTRLANDIGQRRIPFDARGHAVEPVYRDDGLGLWDFSQIDPETSEEIELLVEAARVERREGEGGKSQGDPASGRAGRARPSVAARPEGVVIATYPEWDPGAGIEREDWTTVKEMPPCAADAGELARAQARAFAVRARIARLVRAARVGRASRLRRQSEGHELDLDAAIDLAIARRAGEMPDLRVFRSTALLQRDVAVLVLIDVSHSTRARLADGASVLDVEKLAVVLLGEALARLGDDFALLAFASAGRGDVQLHYVKRFAESFGAETLGRLAGLAPGLSTRLGAALRHAGAEIGRVRAFRKLILVLTDGEPSDIDVAAGDLVQDARRVVLALRAKGIDTFGVTLDPTGVGSGPAIFGKTNTMPVRRVEDLPMRLSELYFRLARR